MVITINNMKVTPDLRDSEVSFESNVIDYYFRFGKITYADFKAYYSDSTRKFIPEIIQEEGEFPQVIHNQVYRDGLIALKEEELVDVTAIHELMI